ncbi:IQ motif and SEC7 domain-containing protein 1-like [Crassostrea virginica]
MLYGKRYFAQEIDLAGLQVDMALRKFQSHFRMPAFASRYCNSIDDGQDVDRDMLIGIYNKIQTQEFHAGVDHVTQVMKVEQTMVGKKLQLALPHRRLVCYCRLYEVHDPNKKEKIGLHQREIFSKKKTGITYSYKHSFPLSSMQVFLFETSRKLT